MENTSFDQANAAADFIRSRTPLRPQIAIVLGSGLGAFADSLQDSAAIRYAQIPNFPQATAIGHTGQLVLGTVADVAVTVMQGRVHPYEGYTAQQVTFPIRVLGRLGIRSLILTNAAGGIRLDMHVGQLVLISDHINLTGLNPAIGPNEDRFGLRFFDMSSAYSTRLRRLAHAAGEAEGSPLAEGVYVSVNGPSFETPAEIRAFRTLGADLVGMSTVLETIAARHMEIEVLGISCVTNMAAGIQKEPLNQYETLEVGRSVETHMAKLLKRLIPTII
jgi:purine-nucleoside phosphorylase